jgi:hypothetical protein
MQKIMLKKILIMKKFNKKDLRLAFASGIDFAVVNHDVPILKTGKFRDKGFTEMYGQLKSIKNREKLLKKNLEIKKD